MKPLVIRADAGGVLGTGHVMRMTALAQAYMRRGGRVVMASVRCPEPVVDRVLESGIEHQLLHGCDLGDAQDAASSLRLCKQLGAEWMVVDGYHFDESYQKQVSGHGIKLLAVDDYGHCATWHCNAVLNQNLGSENWPRAATANPNMQWLMGSSFALIREEFLDSITETTKTTFPLRRILVTMGGADPDNVTKKVLQALEKTNQKDLEIRVLVGGANPHQEELKAFTKSSQNQIEILSNVRDMPAMYEWCDAVISAGGSTCWEWLAYGLPGAVVTIADNQEPIVEELENNHLARSLGWVEKLDQASFTEQLEEWLSHAPCEFEFLRKRKYIDAKGADRVAALLAGSLNIVIATAKEGWLRNMVEDFKERLCKSGHQIKIVYEASDIDPCDVLFLLSFWSLIKNETLRKNTHNIVIHGSDLPSGRGWSPVTWQILDGKNSIPMTLFEAIDDVDAGDIYLRSSMELDGFELLDQIQKKQAEVQFDLCYEFTKRYPELITTKVPQTGQPSFYSRRSGADSELDPHRSIAEQFNLLRTVDNDAYPAFFVINQRKYTLKIEEVTSQ